ncbi:hypothetical protein PR002_g2327 [Phytophthora rubi]|uniref:Uncharacterized protein n=1 Tax=Phytophthora rubi TaxID=129364 RepID=A0A6A3NLA0_9STRA|nr:hypothetical protein PR002_g2327 [Phytophthora rubi]
MVRKGFKWRSTTTGLLWAVVQATTYSIMASYAGTDCSGTPYSVSAYEADADCVEEACSDFQEDSSSVSADMVTFSCTSDYLSALRQVFGDLPYIIQAQYTDEGCKTFTFAYGYPAWGNCEGSYYKNESNYVIGKLSTTDGSASLQIFNETQCLSSSLYEASSASKETLESHS